jgi:hypothetical protein
MVVKAVLLFILDEGMLNIYMLCLLVILVNL